MERSESKCDILQAGVDDMDVIFVGCLPVEVEPSKQEVHPAKNA